MGLNSEIYNLSGGTIQIGSLSSEKGKGNLVKSLASASYNYAASGARDRDQNAFYDNYMRAYNTGAVIASVMHTSKERTAEHAFNSINWNNKTTKASMERMGVLSSSANEKFNDFATKTGLNKTQQSQLGFTGRTLSKDENLGVINKNKLGNQTLNDTKMNNHTVNATMRDMSIKAQNETAKNASIMTAHTSVGKRANLAEIRDKQVTYLKKISLTGDFDGSIKSAKAEIKKNEEAIASLQNMLNQPNLTKDAKDKIKQNIEKYKNNITDFNTYINTGAKANIGVDKGKGYRAHGRQMVMRNFIGNDMYRGIAFYKGISKVATTSVKTAMKSSVGATTTLVKGAVYAPTKIAKKAAPNSKFAKVSEAIYQGTDSVKNTAYKHIDRSKMSKEAKKNEKRNKRLAHREKANKRWAKKGDKLNSKIVDARSAGNAKKLAKLEKKQKNFVRATGLRNRRLARLDNARIINARINGIIHAPQNALKGAKNVPKRFAKYITRKPRAAVGRFVNSIKKKIEGFLKKTGLAAIGAAIGGIATTFMSFLPFIILILGLGAFFGANPASELAEELKNINYIQLIVNETSNTLGRQFTNTAIKQAETYYLTPGNTISSKKYDWTRSVEDATLQNIWASEDMNYSKPNLRHEQLKGVSANLVPIISMMHYRFQEDINFDNYYTAKGYVFFMYVRTRDVAFLNDDDESNDKYAYTYDTVTDCPDEDVFTSMSYDEDTHVVTREESKCNNVYIHGYTSDYNKSVNQKRAQLSSWLSKANINLGISAGSGEANGVFIGHNAPSDSHGTCDNYAVYRGDLECGKEEHNHEDSGEYEGWDCGMEEHVHNDNCYEWVEDRIWDGTYNDSIHEETEDCYEWRDEIGYNIYYECGEIRRATEDDYNDNPDAYSECLYADSDFHTKDHSDHSIKRISEYVIEKDAKKVMVCDGHHEHDDSCKNYIDYSYYNYDNLICGKTEHTHDDCTWGWIKPDGSLCTTEAHTHDPWKSESDEGCYNTAYVCKGHCGGHIKPSINLIMDMEFKTLMEKDCYKITFFLAESDFEHQNTEGTNTIDEWKEKWINQQKVWFYPIPSSPKAALQWGKNKVISTVAKFGSWISGNGWTLSTKKFSTQDENAEDPDDIFKFKGWGKNYKYGDNDNYKLYEDVYSEMHDLYGDYKGSTIPDMYNITWKGRYQQAIEIFESFEVSFPFGFNMVPDAEMKKSVLASIKKYNSGLSENRTQLITNALNAVGEFYYSESKGGQSANAGVNAYQNGLYNKSGPAMSDSFVLGRLYNLPGMKRGYGQTGQDLFNNGNFDHRTKRTGDILVKEDGKMAIYIGHLDKIDKYIVGTSTNTTPSKWKEEGEGNYIIECSEEYGGSVLRRITDSDLKMYRVLKIANY